MATKASRKYIACLCFARETGCIALNKIRTFSELNKIFKKAIIVTSPVLFFGGLKSPYFASS